MPSYPYPSEQRQLVVELDQLERDPELFASVLVAAVEVAGYRAIVLREDDQLVGVRVVAPTLVGDDRATIRLLAHSFRRPVYESDGLDHDGMHITLPRRLV